MTRIGKDIDEARRLLQFGEVVAVPTETVYGLAGNGISPETVARIFEIKNRPRFDPMILHFSDIHSIQPYVQAMPEKGQTLADALWPGPLTLLLSKTDKVLDLVTAGSPKVAVRIPSHPMLAELLQQLDFPLAAPSANPFGYISPTTAQHVADQLGDRIEYILDGGPCEVGLESTIVDVTSEKPVVLRKGGIDIETIDALIGSVEVLETSSSRPTAPGMLVSHYAPRTLFRLLEDDEFPSDIPLGNIGVLAFDCFWPDIPPENQIILSSTGNLGEAARRLFSSMRELDGKGLNLILARRVPDRGLGRAINDKLRRASL